MSKNSKNVLVIGGGVAGLSAAVKLARLGIGVEIIEKLHSPGGHAGQFVCKALDTCARCGACIVEEKIAQAISNPGIKIHSRAELRNITKTDRFSADLVDKNGSEFSLTADAVIIATGFNPFNPAGKPYGYGLFENVITNLELERMLRRQSVIRRPSDKKSAKKIAFIQCVGSRDAKLKHLWCSKICCGSALRAAKLIKSRQPEVDISFFYMDVQTFGKDFQSFYSLVKHDVTMIRAIPGDIYKTKDDQLTVSYYQTGEKQTTDETFDMMILSVGITPGLDNQHLAGLFNITLDNSGFFNISTDEKSAIFLAGTAKGPMSIADAVADADRVALEVINHL